MVKKPKNNTHGVISMTIKNIVWVQLTEVEIFQLVRYRHIESTEFNSVPILFNRMEKIDSIYTYVYTDNANIVIYWVKIEDMENLQHRINSDFNDSDITIVGFQYLSKGDILCLIQKGILLENEVYYINDFESTYESFDSFVYTLDIESIRYCFTSEQLEEVLDEFYS
jgi:hypothetical protein